MVFSPADVETVAAAGPYSQLKIRVYVDHGPFLIAPSRPLLVFEKLEVRCFSHVALSQVPQFDIDACLYNETRVLQVELPLVKSRPSVAVGLQCIKVFHKDNDSKI